MHCPVVKKALYRAQSPTYERTEAHPFIPPLIREYFPFAKTGYWKSPFIKMLVGLELVYSLTLSITIPTPSAGPAESKHIELRPAANLRLIVLCLIAKEVEEG